MDVSYLPVTGTPARPADLTVQKARDLASRLDEGAIQHATLVECRQRDGSDTVVLDVRVEVPNRRVNQVHRREKVAATFYENDDRVPKVEALRSDFPEVPHLNLHTQEYPRDLCLYEEKYEELKRRWTAPRFVNRIREWLELTARGELHQHDQQLEPLLMDYAAHIVLPPDLLTGKPTQLFVTGHTDPTDQVVLLTHRKRPSDDEKSLEAVATVHCCTPQTHGVIRKRPVSVADVASLADAAGLDLIGELRTVLLQWEGELPEAEVIVVLLFPKRRTDDGEVESVDTWCFRTQSVRDLGASLGLWEVIDGTVARLVNPDESQRGQNVPVEVLNPCLALTRGAAAQMNGMPEATDTSIVGIGVGALGSQVVMNLARAGYGRWVLVDPDWLMPHNVARHALDGQYVGFSKAFTTSHAAGSITVEENGFRWLPADLLRPGKQADALDEAFKAADVLIDMTASVAAQRHLSRDAASSARRLSAFLSPSGRDLIVLAEDAGRSVSLDAVEMQYYRALIRDDALADHVGTPGQRRRYARSCGDMTSDIPQDLVGLHAAIAARCIKDVTSSGDAFAAVWRTDADFNVRRSLISVRNVTEFELDPWTVVLDEGLRDILRETREARLPRETGGVLLGSFDLERQILYLVDTLPSPRDSKEETDLYIRGCEGLTQDVDDVLAKTGGMLEYVGEWHSHPRDASTAPSDYDLAAFGWLTALMSNDGLPAVMMIVGDEPDPSLFVGTMGRAPAPIPERGRGE